MRAPCPIASRFFPTSPPDTPPLDGIIFTAFVASCPTVSAALCCSCSSVDRVRPRRSNAWIPPSSAIFKWFSKLSANLSNAKPA